MPVSKSVSGVGRRNNLLALAIAAVPFSLCSTARADRYWINGATSGSWNNAADWNAASATGAGGAGAPGSSDNVYLTNTLASAYTISLNQTGSGTISSLTIGDAASGGSDTLLQSNSFALTVSNNLNVGSVSGSTGAFSISSGTVNVSRSAYVGG